VHCLVLFQHSETDMQPFWIKISFSWLSSQARAGGHHGDWTRSWAKILSGTFLPLGIFSFSKFFLRFWVFLKADSRLKRMYPWEKPKDQENSTLSGRVY
jgi:hypothetical protein